ncbi:hypothetical protein DXG01_009103 [Tephrocybe rancida]|nr:hypothetical protein DXG01_009103 [Tephrocybe rancida]
MAQTFSFAPEIEDEIFTWAARLLPSHAPSLSTVSKRIQRQVEAVMYETLFMTTVTLDPDRHWHKLALAQRFKPTLHARSAEFFSTHVHNIYLQTDVPKEVAKLLLEKCTMLRHLAFLVDPNWLRGAGPWICPLSSTLLTFYTSRLVLVEMADSGVVFPHLKFLGVRVNPYFTRIPSLHWLPALETVKLELDGEAIPSSGWSLDVDTVVSSTSRLRLLVVDVNPECLGYVAPKLQELHVQVAVRNAIICRQPVREWTAAVADGFGCWWDGRDIVDQFGEFDSLSM